MWLADENIPAHAIAFLRQRGEDVVAICEAGPGMTDRQVLALARSQGRTLLSFDRDHGDLVFNQGVEAPRAIVYFRLYPPDPVVLEEILAGLIAQGPTMLAGQLTVVFAEGMRQRPLPSAA